MQLFTNNCYYKMMFLVVTSDDWLVCIISNPWMLITNMTSGLRIADKNQLDKSNQL